MDNTQYFVILTTIIAIKLKLVYHSNLFDLPMLLNDLFKIKSGSIIVPTRYKLDYF